MEVKHLDLIQHEDGYSYHETAVIDPGAQIGKGSIIWHFSHVMDGAKIGEDCSLGQCVFMAGAMGDRCRIQNGAQIFAGVQLYDEVFIGPCVCFTNVLYPRCENPAKPQYDYKATFVGSGTSIGANATIRCGVTIGEHAMIGCGSVITKDVPDYGLMYQKAAKLQGFVDRLGRLTDQVG